MLRLCRTLASRPPLPSPLTTHALSRAAAIPVRAAGRRAAAVRAGDLAKFTSVLEEFGDGFKADETYTLILRLRHNVIKTGVRIISLSYSRISLEAIAEKLCLDSADDAEYIVAKCIRDGVIDATIDHDNRFVASKVSGTEGTPLPSLLLRAAPSCACVSLSLLTQRHGLVCGARRRMSSMCTPLVSHRRHSTSASASASSCTTTR